MLSDGTVKSIHNFGLMGLMKAIPNLETKRFRKSVAEKVFSMEDYEPDEDFTKAENIEMINEMRREAKTYFNFIPDAYFINDSEGTISCYEIEDSNKINMEKLMKYAMAWSFLDYHEWIMILNVYDRYGTFKTKIDLEQAYYATCLSEK